MNCAQARELWHERLDGLSDSAAEAEVETHMSACAACRVWRGQMRQVAGALDELRVQTEQVGVNPSREREGVVISIDGPHVRPRRRPAAWWAFGRIAAGMVLIAAIVPAVWFTQSIDVWTLYAVFLLSILLLLIILGQSIRVFR